MITAKEARKNFDETVKTAIKKTLSVLSRKIPEVSGSGRQSVEYIVECDGKDIIYREVKKVLKGLGYRVGYHYDQYDSLVIGISW